MGRTAEERREEGGNSEEKDKSVVGALEGQRVEARPPGGGGPCLSLTGPDKCAGLGHGCSRALGSGLRRVLSLASCGHETGRRGLQSQGQNGARRAWHAMSVLWGQHI